MTYATVAEMRTEGVPVSIVDAAVQRALDSWQAFIERETRQWFEPRTITMDIDGTDSPLLHLPVPVISVTSLYINGDFDNVVDATQYKVYSSRDIPDDRRNPKIALITSPSQDIFQLGLARMRLPSFVKGMRNQRVVGSFGFTDAAGVTPPLIKRALMKLVINQLIGGATLWQAAGATRPAGRVTMEQTDNHMQMYDGTKAAPKSATNGATGDPEVDRIISIYRAVPTIAVPGSYTLALG